MNKSISGLFMAGGLLLSSFVVHAGSPQELFVQNCSSCHNTDGSGIDGLAPPLVNEALWSKLDKQAPLYLIGVMSNGMSGKLHVNGQDYIGMVMPPVMIDHQEKMAIAGHVLELNGMSSVTRVQETDVPTLTHQALRAMRNSSGSTALALQQ